MEIIFLLLILLVFMAPMFLMQRKQKKQMDEIKQLQNSVTVGDRVMTTAGLHGDVRDVTENEVFLEIAPNVVTKWEKISVVKKIETSAPELTESLEADTDDAAKPNESGAQ